MDELAEAWVAYVEEGDQVALDFLVRKYAPLANYLAQRALAKAPAHQDAGEILSFAQDGLLDALRKYDPSQGAKFETYATRRIAGEIVDGLRRKDPLGRMARRQVKVVEAATVDLRSELHRAPTLDELAERSGLSIENVRTANLMRNSQNASLDWEEMTNAATSHSDHEARAQIAEMAIIVAHRLAGLDAPQRALVLAYYVGYLNLKETAEVLHMSPGRCRRIRSEVWSHLAGRALSRTAH